VAGAASATVSASEATSSTTYTNLTTPGPQVTLTVPASGSVLIIVTAQITGSTGNAAGFMSVTVDGAIPLAVGDPSSLRVAGNNAVRASATALVTGLSPGSHTFSATYRLQGSGTATFSDRNIVVIPA
jgi:ethanolamine utilization microcompartment shell protein EutL